MNHLADNLIERIKENKSCVAVGLDPVIGRIPYVYKKEYADDVNLLRASSMAILDYNKDVIDSVCGLVCSVKPQIAFYENYGCYGIEAFQKTVEYAKEKGLIVIEDGKRNDIGNTVKAYASGHLGEVELIDGSSAPVYNVDFLTVSAFLGFESIEPFISDCEKYDKGIFVLTKTSNKDSADIQDKMIDGKISVSEWIAENLEKKSYRLTGNKYGYSSLGAVVGATYPQEAKRLRKIMKNNIFLVPGYGAQGADASTIISSFNADGLGAIVSASRSILYSYEKYFSNESCSKKELTEIVRSSCMEMKNDIYDMLKANYSGMVY